MPTPTLHADVMKGDPNTPVVVVVDDDNLMRSSLRRLFASAGFAVELHASGAEFLSHAKLGRPGCLLLDIGMPGMSGLDVQSHLNRMGSTLPVIFLTGSSQIAVAVAAMREGAVDFIEKPFDNDDMVARVRKAIVRNDHQRKDDDDKQTVLQRLSTLTPRECAVIDQLVVGKTNREIARALAVSPRTIDVHRGNLMQKMSARTLAGLVRMHLLVENERNPYLKCDPIEVRRDLRQDSGDSHSKSFPLR